MNRSLRTEVDLKNEDALMRPGMYVTVSVRLAHRPDVLTLPVAEIIREGNAARCCIVLDGKIQFRTLELGLRSGDDSKLFRASAKAIPS